MAVSLEDRFFAKVDAEGICWEWTAATMKNGYGVFNKGNRKTALAHRFVWELLVGPIPDNHQIDHLCRNRKCVNPDHLEPVLQVENLRRGYSPAAINKRKTHCVNGHDLEIHGVSISTRPGQRNCGECTRLWQIENYKK